MLWPFISRRRHEDILAGQQRAARRVIDKATASNNAVVEGLATKLSDLKDEVALHIVAAEHPSSALSDARSMALALREACEARGIDLRIELGRLDGSDL
jgi:hypothetical protein